MIPCRFGCDPDAAPAVVRVAMPKGCVCFPDDREQYLCAQHWYKSTPLGAAVVIEELCGTSIDDCYWRRMVAVPVSVRCARCGTTETIDLSLGADETPEALPSGMFDLLLDEALSEGGWAVSGGNDDVCPNCRELDAV